MNEESMRLIIQPSYQLVSKWAANYVALRIREFRPAAKRRFVLGLPTGSSPLGMYKELINLNKKGIKLGIISGNSTKTIKDFLNNKTNIGKVKFDHILTTDGKNEGKTKADLIKESLKLWKIQKKDCIYIGDHPNDILAAKEAGVISAGVSTGVYRKDELKSYNPDILIEKLDELNSYIG